MRAAAAEPSARRRGSPDAAGSAAVLLRLLTLQRSALLNKQQQCREAPQDPMHAGAWRCAPRPRSRDVPARSAAAATIAVVWHRMLQLSGWWRWGTARHVQGSMGEVPRICPSLPCMLWPRRSCPLWVLRGSVYSALGCIPPMAACPVLGLLVARRAAAALLLALALGSLPALAARLGPAASQTLTGADWPEFHERRPPRGCSNARLGHMKPASS